MAPVYLVTVRVVEDRCVRRVGTLAAFNLVAPGDGRWVLVTGTSLRLLAEQFGCTDTVRPR